MVDSGTAAILNLKKVASSQFFNPTAEVVGNGAKREDPKAQAKPAPQMELPVPVKKVRGPASKTIKQAAVKRKEANITTKQDQPSTGAPKKAKMESSYFVEKVHVCKICHGKDENGRVDKEALNLSFR